MAEEPIYIPRKFRKDHFHVKSQAELNHIIISFEQQRFSSECEIMKLRLSQTEKEIESLDRSFNTLVDENNLCKNAKYLTEKRFQECISEDLKYR